MTPRPHLFPPLKDPDWIATLGVTQQARRQIDRRTAREIRERLEYIARPGAGAALSESRRIELYLTVYWMINDLLYDVRCLARGRAA